MTKVRETKILGCWCKRLAEVPGIAVVERPDWTDSPITRLKLFGGSCDGRWLSPSSRQAACHGARH